MQTNDEIKEEKEEKAIYIQSIKWILCTAAKNWTRKKQENLQFIILANTEYKKKKFGLVSRFYLFLGRFDFSFFSLLVKFFFHLCWSATIWRKHCSLKQSSNNNHYGRQNFIKLCKKLLLNEILREQRYCYL